MAAHHFDINRFTELLKNCYNEDLDLHWYIEAYKEVNKLLAKLNVLFSFIISDIESKLKNLSQRLNSSEGHHYTSIKSMLDFEIENHILQNDLSHSGAHSLLPLHRAMNFVVKLIETVKLSQDNDKMSTMATTSYDSTLARFHAWPIRKAVHAAFLTLPTRKKFLAELVNLNVSKQESDRVMDDVVQAGYNVYNRVQLLFADRDLLNLNC